MVVTRVERGTPLVVACRTRQQLSHGGKVACDGLILRHVLQQLAHCHPGALIFFKLSLFLQKVRKTVIGLEPEIGHFPAVLRHPKLDLRTFRDIFDH